MRNRMFVILSIVAACGIISAAYAQMFDTKPADKKVVPGINKIPPLLPVLSPGEFQSKVKSLSDDNRSAMTQKGFDTIQQQRDALPTVKPDEPPPLTPPKTADSDKNPSATQTPASAQTPASNAASAEQSATDTEEAEDNNTPNQPTPSDSGSTSSNAPTPPKSAPSPGGSGLNIQY